LLAQEAQHILRPFGVDCALRRWGLRLAEHGGRSGKKRAIIAPAAARLEHKSICTVAQYVFPDASSRIAVRKTNGMSG